MMYIRLFMTVPSIGSYEHQPSMNMNSLSWQGNGVSNNRISTSANNYNGNHYCITSIV